MHFVDEVISINNKKAKVKLDSGFTFALYKGEIRKYGIKQDDYINDETVSVIFEEILPKRARERALYLIERAPKTERQVRDKLKADLYPEAIIDYVISFLKKYGFVDDMSYALNYIQVKTGSKSIMRMKQDLMLKGVSKDIISKALDESDTDEEKSLIRLIEKKISKYDLNDIKEKKRFYLLLMRNGYSFDSIERAITQLRNE